MDSPASPLPPPSAPASGLRPGLRLSERVTFPGGAADHGARRRHRQRDRRAPGRHRRGRDRLGQDDAAAEDLPRDGPRRERRRSAARSRGASRRPASRRAWRRSSATELGEVVGYKVRFNDKVKRTLVREVHDRRHPARRDPGRPAAARLRHDHHRRGARAQPQHRLPPRLPQAPAAAAARSARHRQLGDARDRAVRRVLRRRAGDRGLGPHVPGRRALPPAARRRGRPRRRGRQHGQRDHRDRSAQRRARVPAGRARDPRGDGRARAARAAAHGGAAALRAALGGRAAARVPALAAAARRARDQRRRDLAHDPGHRLRRRRGRRARQPLQRAHRRVAAPGRADLAGERRSAQGPLRPHRERRVLPALRGAGLRVAARAHRSRDQARRPRRRDPADEGAAASATSSSFPFLDPPQQARDRRGLPRARGARRDRRRRRG